MVCYDVVDDRRRHQLAKRLEQCCQRVQYSVVECPLDTAELEKKLEKLWLPLLNLQEDSLRASPLRAAGLPYFVRFSAWPRL